MTLGVQDAKPIDYTDKHHGKQEYHILKIFRKVCHLNSTRDQYMRS